MSRRTWEEVVAELDKLALMRPEIRHYLVEVRESRWCTGTFLGSSRAPSLATLELILAREQGLAERERLAKASTMPAPPDEGESLEPLLVASLAVARAARGR